MPDPRPTEHAAALSALARYDLPHRPLRPIRTSNNALFEVTAGPPGRPASRYALRVHRPGYRTAAQIRSEHHLLRTLGQQLPDRSIAVPEVIPARGGAALIEVTTTDGSTRHCDLLSWIDGQVRRPGRGLGPRATHRLGQALAHVHNLTAALDPPPGFDLPHWDAEAMFGPASDQPFEPLAGFLNAVDWRLYQEVAGRTRTVLSDLADQRAPYGVLHFDYILGNCHLRRDRDGWRVGILDFNDSGWGYLLYDLCPLLGNLADFPGYPARRRAFLAGYRSVRQLPARVEPLLPLLMAARHVQSALWTAQLAQLTGDIPRATAQLTIRMQLIRHCLALPY
jgi:Ser/Thr protein kinase RdoA (MazF antagonist)